MITPPAALRSYAIISLINTIGTGIFMAGSVVYFRNAIGINGAQIGFGLSLATFISLAGHVPAGRIGDRVGHRRTLCALNCATGLAFGFYPLIRSYAGFLVIACAISLLQAASNPTGRALLNELIPANQRVRGSAYLRSVSNVGFTIGTAVTGGLVLAGSRPALDAIVLANAVSYLIAAALTVRLQVRGTSAIEGPVERAGLTAGPSPYRDRRFLAVSVLSGLLMTHESLLAVALPLFVLEDGGPAWLIPMALITNTVLAIALQVPASRGAEGFAGGARSLARAAVGLVCCCGVFAIGQPGLGWMLLALTIVGTLALTAGELLSSVGAWSVSYAMADGQRPGEYLGAFSMIQQATAIGGPMVMAYVVHVATPGWLGLACCYALLGIGVLLIAKRPVPPGAVTADSARM